MSLPLLHATMLIVPGGVPAGAIEGDRRGDLG
jgi:hypothetical protein